MDRLLGEQKENAERSTSNAQRRIFAAKPLWSAAA
jgi:hypothetical protein